MPSNTSALGSASASADIGLSIDKDQLNRLIANSGSDCMLVLSADGRIQQVGESTQRLLELADPAQLTGVNWLSIWEAPERGTVRDAIIGARQGKTVEREPRFVHVFAHEINSVHLPEIDFRVVCSKGFYVRTYAFDIGGELGCGAHLKALRRTKSGRFDLQRSVTVADLQTKEREDIVSKIISLPEVSRLRGA